MDWTTTQRLSPMYGEESFRDGRLGTNELIKRLVEPFSKVAKGHPEHKINYLPIGVRDESHWHQYLIWSSL
jgi:hypothetical protein